MSEQKHASESEHDLELRNDILKTVAYFALFDYPLTTDQIYTFLPRNSVSPEHVAKSAEELAGDCRLTQSGGFYMLPDSDPSISGERMVREQRAKRMFATARAVSHLIKMFPFIRGIFITGALSKNVAESSGDIDFMIVTVPGRLWISRTLLTLFRKVFLFGSSKFFCTNYYVTENGLQLDRRNLYTAVEVVTTRVVWNADVYETYRRENGWTAEFLPNYRSVPDERLLISSRRSIIQRLAERVLLLLPLRSLDERLMEYHRKYWQEQYGSEGATDFNSKFIITPDISASWPEDRQVPVLTRFRATIARLGLR